VVMDKEGLLKENFDAVFYLGDGPKVPIDTFDKFAGFPLFSIRTSPVHIDIPIPDPVVYGSNGAYVWPAEAIKATPWGNKMPTAVFRGKASCLKMQADNWHTCNRVRATKLSNELLVLHNNTNKQKSQLNNYDEFPLLDIGITEWNQIEKNIIVQQDGYGLISFPSAKEIESSTGIHRSPFMNFYNQSRYKYILDLDGGLGSSRKVGILNSGSLLIMQDSPWKNWYDPCLKPFYHFIPFARDLSNLINCVKWARQNDQKVQHIVKAARDFADRFLSFHSAKLYFSTLLNLYAKEILVDKDKIDDSVIEINYCQKTGNKDIPNGPMGCSQGWLEWNMTSLKYWDDYMDLKN